MLQASWKASVLVCLVLLVQWILGRRLSPRWRYGLWCIVLIRLLAPGLPESPVSVYSLARPAGLPRAPEASLRGSSPDEFTAMSTADERVVADQHQEKRGTPSAAARSHATVSAEVPLPTGTAADERSSAPRFTAIDWCALAWLLGVMAIGTVNTTKLLRFRRQLSHATPITDPRLTELVHCCHLDLGLSRHIPVLETSAVSSPTLFGVSRPSLLLPRKLTEQFSVNELHHVILHELLHYKRRDAWVNVLVSVLVQLHWFNPLLILAAWRVRVELEMACDAAVVEQLPRGHSKLYGETILKCLASWTTAADSSGLRMWSRSGEMRQRLNQIVRFSSRRTPVWIALTAIALLILIGLTDPRLLRQIEAVGVPTQSLSDSQRLEALMRQTQWDFGCWDPVESVVVEQATVRVVFSLPDGSTHEVQGLTDARGQWKVEPPLRFDRIVRASAAKPGYVPVTLTAKGDNPIDPIHISQFRLSRPERIAGTVIDPTGAPVEGALIAVSGRDAGGAGIKTYGPGEASATTDSSGRWSIDQLNRASIFELSVAKSGYVSRTNKCGGPPLFPFQQGALQLGTDISLFLARPTAIQGSVVDWRGNPIGGASVLIRRGGDGFQDKVVTGANGQFSFSSIPPDYSTLQNMPSIQELTLLVRATNCAPVVRTLPREISSIEGLRVVLSPGQRFEGHVIDQDRQPVPDAHVRTDFGASLKTDERGVFLVEHAPDTLHVSVQKEGYDSVASAVIIPLIQTNAITLRRLGHIQGTVSDSVTREPLPSFRLMLLPEHTRVTVNDPSSVIISNFTGGRFTLATSALYPRPRRRLLIQAPDYRTVITDVVDGRSGDVTLDIALEREPWIHGTVVSVDGTPVEGASVSLVSSKSEPWDSAVQLMHPEARSMVELIIGTPLRTPPDGEFHVPRIHASILEALRDNRRSQMSSSGEQSGTHDFIVVKHPLGFVESPLESWPEDGKLVLQPLGTIKGRIGSAPAVQHPYTVQISRLVGGTTQAISYGPGSEQPRSAEPQAHAVDEHGTFEARNLYPGTYEVILMFPLSSSSSTSFHGERVEVRPGTTTEVTLLGDTRLAKGRVVCASLTNFEWSPHLSPMSDGLGSRAGLRQFTSGTAPAASRTPSGRGTPLRFEPDGSFLTANLAPGTYELSLMIGDGAPHVIDEFKPRRRNRSSPMSFDPRERPRSRDLNRLVIFELLTGVAKSPRDPGDWIMGAAPIACLRSVVEIPPGPADTLVDLGTLEVVSQLRLDLGDPAPHFDIEALDGGRIRLSDYHGKWLTLFFWHSGGLGTSCEMELRNLNMLWTDFRDKPQFALAGVVLDEHPEDARKSAAAAPELRHGYDGGWKTSQLVKQFGIIAVPSTFLIDPEGKIAGYNLWSQPLADVLDKIVASREQK
ncbi:MAG: carboxypeptidase regulatory-like domain-containing protein [Verrucomicrobia bacterium]|nr:carboxypeptidase regulatory-like domain-containing protein [Verrucomicrobiota bacterium]